MSDKHINDVQDVKENGETSDDEKKKKKVEEPIAEFVPEVWFSRSVETEKLDVIDIVPLTEQNKIVIRETWVYVSEQLTDNGTKIFLRIFEVNSNIRSVFHFAVSTPLEALASNKHLNDHSTRFMQAVQAAVEHLDELSEVVAPMFTNLGKRHIYFKNLKDDFFQVFSGAMMYVWRESLGDKLTPEVRTAWSRLFDYILQHLKFGYEIAAAAEKAKQK